MKSTCYIALGSNLGDRLNNLREAIRQLKACPDISLSALASIYETKPIGPPGQQSYYNSAIRIETGLPPRDLLTRCQEIEKQLKRVRKIRWGPRTLDLDILLYGERVIQEPGLQIPHPGLLERDFVLIPLLEIAPDLEVQGQRIDRALHLLLPATSARRLEAGLTE